MVIEAKLECARAAKIAEAFFKSFSKTIQILWIELTKFRDYKAVPLSEEIAKPIPKPTVTAITEWENSFRQLKIEIIDAHVNVL